MNWKHDVCIVLLVLIAALAVTSLAFNLRPATKPSGSSTKSDLVWFAGFENGVHGDFNNSYVDQSPVSAYVGVSGNLFHSGGHSGFYYYTGAPYLNATRAYIQQYFSPAYAKFHLQMWVYIPSSFNGTQTRIASWVSLASLWFNDNYWRVGANPLTIDSNAAHQLELYFGMLSANQRYYYQPTPVMWSFDEWFKIGVYVVLNPNSTSRVELLQNDAVILTWVGILPSTETGLTDAHFGLYADGATTPIAVYNDDIAVFTLPTYVSIKHRE